MKNKVILSLFTVPLVFAFTNLLLSSCNPIQGATPNMSPSASTNVSSSVSPSPSASVDLSQSPSASPSMSAAPSVTTSSMPVTSNCVDLVVGQEYDSTVFNMYCPPVVKVGTKWVYVNSTIPVTQVFDATAEVIKMLEKSYLVKFTVNNTSRESIAVNAGFGVREEAKFIFEGLENIQVPAGTYPDSAKFSTVQTDNNTNAKLTYWVAKNVGVVRVVADADSPTIGKFSTLTDLKSFTP